MSLEERVTTLEQDVAILRGETHGWAEVAVSAKNRADAAGELLRLVHHDVAEIKHDVHRHTEQLDRHTEQLDRHTELLDRHTELLDRHTELLEEILARLPER